MQHRIRPDLSRYSGLMYLPDATDEHLSVTFLGVATLLISDGQSAIMTDGFFSRPGLSTVLLRRLRSQCERIDAALGRAGVTALDAVVPLHTHYDHALDSVAVAERTGAVIIGGDSTKNIAPAARFQRATAAATVHGRFELALIPTGHCPPDRFPGEITAPLRQPARASAYRCGEAWSLLIRHSPSGRRLLVVGSAGYVEGALSGWNAEVAYLGVGQLGKLPDDYLEAYWQETVRTVGARTVVLTHWDDFSRPLDRPLVPLPYLFDNLDRTVEVLGGLASRDRVSLHLPQLWQRADPWVAAG